MESSSFHKRSARARREQALRAEARTLQRMVKCMAALSTHRGSQPTQLGAALALALQQPTDRLSSTPPLCRHFALGRCTWGDRCRFSHGDVYASADADRTSQPCAASASNSDVASCAAAGLPLTTVLPPAPVFSDYPDGLLEQTYYAAAAASVDTTALAPVEPVFPAGITEVESSGVPRTLTALDAPVASPVESFPVHIDEPDIPATQSPDVTSSVAPDASSTVDSLEASVSLYFEQLMKADSFWNV